MSVPFNLVIFCLYNRRGQARTSTDEECRVNEESDPYLTEHDCIHYR